MKKSLVDYYPDLTLEEGDETHPDWNEGKWVNLFETIFRKFDRVVVHWMNELDNEADIQFVDPVRSVCVEVVVTPDTIVRIHEATIGSKEAQEYYWPESNVTFEELVEETK